MRGLLAMATSCSQAAEEEKDEGEELEAEHHGEIIVEPPMVLLIVWSYVM